VDPTKILVVDASLVIVHWVDKALAGQARVRGVTAADDVATAVAREQPDVVLVDPDLPGLGEEAVRKVREGLGAHPAVVALFSRQSRAKLETRAAALKADAAIEKSGDADSFAARVKALKGMAPRPTGAVPSMDPETIVIAGDTWSANLLRQAGFSVVTLARARAVIDAVGAWRPALLVVGPDLPDATAVELCREIRSDRATRAISILFVGAPGEGARANRARLAGANETLVHPVDEMTLVQTVDRLATVAARRTARLLVRVEVNVESRSELCVGFSHDISESGMLVETDRPLENDQPLTLRFFIPGCDEEIVTGAEVARLQCPTTAGVRFSGIKARDRRAIDAFVSGGDPAHCRRGSSRARDDPATTGRRGVGHGLDARATHGATTRNERASPGPPSVPGAPGE
jgi:DNA-binding response OmpR family regulator